MTSWEMQADCISCLQLQHERVGEILNTISSLKFHIIHDNLAVFVDQYTSINCPVTSHGELEVVDSSDWRCEETYEGREMDVCQYLIRKTYLLV